LARAEEHFASSDVTRGRELVADALANTKDTLTELRDLVRGIRPPALDLGLSEAVQTRRPAAPYRSRWLSTSRRGHRSASKP
jgi:signal transduction histidine kinase